MLFRSGGVHKNVNLEQHQESYVSRFVQSEAEAQQLANSLFDGSYSGPGEFGFQVRGYKIPKGSPIFRNPDGTPKSSITGLAFDISTPSERINTLFARSLPATYAAAATRTRDIFFSPTALKGSNSILQQASLLAHEHSHILFSKARSGAFGPEVQQKVSDFEAWVKTMNPHEAETFVDVLGEVWLGKEWKELPGVGDVLKNVRNEDGKVDVEEVMANVFGAFAAGLSKPRNPTKLYTMLPRVVRDVFDWVMKQIQSARRMCSTVELMMRMVKK